ncbi:MAG: hypothetical protein KDE31_07720 [Caldilineaceae bacterium]|nr:hypothetical protein [Caldilineaceae bacterium]
MAADLRKRQERLAADDERRQDFTEELTTLDAERQTKLADARGRYTLRVETKLVNVLLVTQPKIALPMVISNRTAKITRTAVWDPLRHQLEPLVCDVCGRPGEDLHPHEPIHFSSFVQTHHTAAVQYRRLVGYRMGHR